MESLSIITPVTRPENLDAIAESIAKADINAIGSFDIIWYLIWDTEMYWRVMLPYECGVFIYSRPCFSGKMKMEVNGKTTEVKINSYGAKQRNFGVDQTKAGWVYFLDDDNVMDENFLLNLSDEIKDDPFKKVFLFDQYLKDGTLRLKASLDSVKVEHIDTAQFVIDREFLGDVRWEPKQCGDGFLMETLYAKDPSVFKVSKGRCWYNYLR
jgi:hypothetical protein